MSVTVRIPTQLRTLTGGAGEIPVEGATVGEALKALDAAHPGLRRAALRRPGGLRRFVNVFLADEDVRFLDGLRHRARRPARPSRSSRRSPAAELRGAVGPEGRRDLLLALGPTESANTVLRFRRESKTARSPVRTTTEEFTRWPS